MARPYRWKEAQIAQEVEGAPGTAETLLLADVFIAQNIVLTPNWGNTPNAGQTGVLSKEPGASGLQSATLEFEMLLKASGTAATPPMFGELLLGCGFAETINASVVYTPASPETTLTLGVIVPGFSTDALSFVMAGCMGNVVFTLKAGEPYLAKFTFTGAGPVVTDGAVLVPAAWESTAPQAYIGTATLMDAVAVPFETLTIDMGHEVGIRPDPSTSSTTGVLAAQITDRRVTGTIDLEAEKLTVFDIWSRAEDNDVTGGITMTPTGAAGYKLDFALPKVRFYSPTIGDRNGVMTTPVSFESCRSAVAGNDEITITHS
jgi:hypothetical protein